MITRKLLGLPIELYVFDHIPSFYYSILSAINLPVKLIDDCYLADTEYKIDDRVANVVSKCRGTQNAFVPLLVKFLEKQGVELNLKMLNFSIELSYAGRIYDQILKLNYVKYFVDHMKNEKKIFYFTQFADILKEFLNHSTFELEYNHIFIRRIPAMPPSLRWLGYNILLLKRLLCLRRKGLVNQPLNVLAIFATTGIGVQESSGPALRPQGERRGISDYASIRFREFEKPIYYLLDRKDLDVLMTAPNFLDRYNTIPLCLPNVTYEGLRKFRAPLTIDKIKEQFILMCAVSVLIIKSLLSSARCQYDTASFCSLLFQSFYYRTIFKCLGITVVKDYRMCAPNPISIAIDTFGIQIGVQSSYYLQSFAAQRSDHVYFVWGEHSAQVYRNSGSVSKYIVISGVSVQPHEQDRERQSLIEAKQRMSLLGVTKYIMIFDSSTKVDKFYQFISSWMQEDSSLGIFLKPKQPSIVLEYAKKKSVFNFLENPRFCLVDTQVTPADATGIADFNLGLTTRSAIMVSAIYGGRVLYYDPEKKIDELHKSSPLDSLGENRCVFQSMIELKKAVSAYYKNPHENHLLGDASEVINKIDPFRDGKTSERITEFITGFMKYKNLGDTTEHALSRAIQAYKDKWGSDKVY